MDDKENRLLCEKLKKFKQELYSVTGSSLFRTIDYSDCIEICEYCNIDDFIRTSILNLTKVMESISLDYDEKHNNFHKQYWELFSYYFLKYKKNIEIEKIKESSKKNSRFSDLF